MQTNTLEVNIVLEDITKDLPFPCTKLKASIEAGAWVLGPQKHLLLPTANTTTIVRGKLQSNGSVMLWN